MSPKKSKTKPRKSKVAKKKTVKKVKAKGTKKPASRARSKAKPKKKAAVRPKKKAPARPKKATQKAPAKPKKKTPAKDSATRKTPQAVAAPVVVKPAPAPAEATKTKKTKGKGRSRRSSRRAALIRRGPDGEILAPGDLLLPGGAKGAAEIAYLFRGCMAAERPASEDAVNEVLAKRGVPEGPGEREELERALEWARKRFGGGDVEPVIPTRSNLRRTFQGVVDRARQRRREIGAFLRGLDMGRTETSHMDSHGEASLQSLMEWAARLENLVENLAEAPNTSQTRYVQFQRVLDQLESTTEALVIDVEQTLRRLRDRVRR